MTTDNLSPMERIVAEMIAQGMTHRQIAEKLGKSVKTIGVHAQHINMKRRAAAEDQR